MSNIIKKLEKLGIHLEKGNEISTVVETLTRNELSLLDQKYVVVDKADGLRAVLYIDDGGNIFELDKTELTFKDIKIKVRSKKVCNSLIDTEYIPKLDAYFMFDILIFNDVDVREKPFKERYELIEIFSKLKNDRLFVKEYIVKYENIFKAAKEVYHRKHPYKLDGLIFTPLDGKYVDKSLKWKPIKDLTIDFICKIRKEFEKNGKRYLILDLYVIMNRYQMYNMELKYPPNYFKTFPMIDKTFQMIPYPFMPEFDPKYSYAVVEVTTNIEMKDARSISRTEIDENLAIMAPAQSQMYYYKKYMNDDPTTKKYKIVPIMDNSIVEFNYDINFKGEPSQCWRPYRFRQDRTVQYWTTLFNNEHATKKLLSGPNSWIRAQRIWNMYETPITNEMIFGDEAIPQLYYVQTDIDRKNTRNMIHFHLFLKEQLYKNYIFYRNYTETLFELSAGDGSDAAHIVDSNLKYVLCTDLIETSLKKLERDMRKFQNLKHKHLTKFDTIPLDLREDNIKAVAGLIRTRNVKTFDVISIQFAFHYMMETEKSFTNLFNLINTYLAKGGFFFMTCFDGELVYNRLKNKDSEVITVENEKDKVLFKIDKLYDGKKAFNDLDMFGTPIDVFIYSIGSHKEYLVNFTKLIKYFKAHGMDLVETMTFEQVSKSWKGELSAPEKKFSFLNRYAVFQKSY